MKGIGVISKIFGSDKVIEKTSQGIDKMFFTKEEKAEAWVNTLKAYEPFKLAQRLIALIVTCVYLMMWIMSAIMLVLSYWLPSFLELSKLLAETNNDMLSLPFALIVGFYFGGGAFEGVVNKLRVKK